MAKYETMLVTTATLDEEATAALVGKFKSLIEANGTIDSVEDWGKRRLAYPINKENEGIYTPVSYTHLLFLLDTASAAHAASSFAYMPAQHVQAVILYPAAAYVCGLPESANLMNAYLLVLERIPAFLGSSETIYTNALRQYDLYHAAFLRREMEPPLDAIACEVVRALDPSRVSVPEVSAMLSSIRKAYQLSLIHIWAGPAVPSGTSALLLL